MSSFYKQTVSLKFAVLGGSSTEGGAKGAAHFLAHAAFAGNQTSSGLKLVKHLENLGATFESHADREKVCCRRPLLWHQ